MVVKVVILGKFGEILREIEVFGLSDICLEKFYGFLIRK